MPGQTKRPSSVKLNVNNLRHHPAGQYVAALGVASLTSAMLYVYGALVNNNWQFGYLLWNLFLAWLPLVLAVWLVQLLKKQPWISIWPLILTLGWLVFLPNSFYMISDYIHLQGIQRVDILFDTIMFSSFIFVGLAVGFTSVLLVHRELNRRLKPRPAGWLIGIVLALCSYAIFLGRYLRWNTWDVILNPASLLFDVSERFIHPSRHPQMLLTTLSFFILLSSLYLVIRRAIALLRSNRSA